MNTSHNNFLIAVSYYESRNIDSLCNFLADIEKYKSNTLVVVNSDKITDKEIKKTCSNGWNIHIRNNMGMNIGAWNHAFLSHPDKDYYFFFQDECHIKQNGFIERCIEKFEIEPSLGMLGESLNQKWDKSWHDLQRSNLNWVDSAHLIEGKQVPRVLFYQSVLNNLNIKAGKTGAHLRSLCWAFRGDALRQLDGFPEGKSKGECIAIEIGVSRKIDQLGYRFSQIAHQPFKYIGHHEWRDDGISKI